MRIAFYSRHVVAIITCSFILITFFYHWKLSSHLSTHNDYNSVRDIQVNPFNTYQGRSKDSLVPDVIPSSHLPKSEHKGTPSTCTSPIRTEMADINMQTLYEKMNFENPDGGKWKQGWNVSYSMERWNDRSLEVVILPHSHQDPGWLSTFDGYFYAQTKPCLDSTLDFLGKNENTRFIYAEVSFLEKWWANLSPSEKAAFTKLVADGKWEIATGGWVVNDEATTHYAATITQLTEGQHWLMDNLGYFPNVSWVVDTFGHSTSEAYLLNKVGIEHMLINRVHYAVKKYLALDTNLEFMWRQPWDRSGKHDMFCHMMPFYSYDVSHTCGPDPSVCCQFDFLRAQKYPCPWGIPSVLIDNNNIKSKASLLADQYRKKAILYDNNDVILIPLGDDFRFTSRKEWDLQIKNYEKLIHYINSNPDFKMHIQFGTLSSYFNLVHGRSNQKNFSTLIGDFFTYSDRDQHYWSGFYTTRPTHKALSRALEAELRFASTLRS